MEKFRPPESVVNKTKSLTKKQLFDVEWARDKVLRHQDNANHRDKVSIGGTFYIHGIGHKKGQK